MAQGWWQVTPDGSEQISYALVERFVQAFDDFLACLKDAIAHASADSSMASSGALSAWQTRALPVLERYQSEMHAAAEAFMQGDAALIVKQAQLQGALAKNLDGYPLDFAGPEYAKKLDDTETVVVVTSYRVCQAAGLP